MPDDREADIEHAIDVVVHAAGSNPATTCRVRVNTHLESDDSGDDEEDGWAVVTFDAILPDGREIALESHFVEVEDEADLEALKAKVAELWRPGAVEGEVARLLEDGRR